MKATLYAAYHKLAPRLEGPSIAPIHVGRALAGQALPHMIGDDTGDNISERNGAWCELTALYWAWKNDHGSDYVGLMHYRRVLDLTDRMPTGGTEQTPHHFDVDDWSAEVQGWIDAELSNYDMIVPRKHQMGRSARANYAKGHAAQDWDFMGEIIARDHPEFAPSFEAVAQGRDIRLGNMALMARPLLDRYCSWLFDILEKVEAAPLDRSTYSPYQARYIGFLAERLMTVFVHHIRREQPELRIKEVSILNLAGALVTPYLGPQDAPPPETVNIALSADRAYLPHAAAMLRSVMDHADPSRAMNVFFLHSDIDGADLQPLERMLRERRNITFHPLNIGGWFDDSYRSASRAPSNATYNRFLLFALLPGVGRLLYLDVDIIAKADICDLFDTDIGAAKLAAVPDWIMTRTLSGPTPTAAPEVPDLAQYHRQTLGLSDAQIARYFNAGVLLLNFAAMDDPRATGDTLLKQVETGKYLFRDQDILNMQFKDSLHVLDPRWNVFNSSDESYARVPAVNHARAMEARQAPWIVHYADRAHKPWTRVPVPYSGDYWSALIRTPFYAEVVHKLSARANGAPRRNQGIVVRSGRQLAERLPWLRAPLLRLYALLRG